MNGGGIKTRSYLFYIWLLAIAAVLAAGCGSMERAVKKSYFVELDRWTRSEKIYYGLETRVYLNATFKAPSFRKAYIDRYSMSYDLDENYKSALLARESEVVEQFNEFFISFYTPNEKWNDLDRKDSIWKLYLEDNKGSRLVPISIDKIDEKDPLLREFFPYFDLWGSAYIVKFPKYPPAGLEPVPGEDTEYFKLIITGILGKGELKWRLKN